MLVFHRIYLINYWGFRKRSLHRTGRLIRDYPSSQQFQAGIDDTLNSSPYINFIDYIHRLG